MTDRLLLVGMMGSGKTTVGRLVADRLGWAYIDSDAQIVLSTGRTVKEIFELEGEAAFRRQESAALRAALERERASVIAVAGGAVLDPSNRELIRNAGCVIWLRAPLDVLSARAAGGDHRPLLAGDGGDRRFFKLYEEREPFYIDLADHEVDTYQRTPDDIANEIVELVK